MTRLHTSTRSGFTLIELLVVIGIMGVVTTLGVTAFAAIIGEWRETKAMVVLDNNVTFVFEHIENDLSDVLSAELSGVSIAGEDRTWKDEKKFKDAPDQDDRIIIPVQGNSSTNTILKPSSINYELKHVNGESYLVRSISDLGKNEWSKESNIIDGVDTVAFDIQYATDSGWVDEWTASALPKAVRVGIAVANRDNHNLQLSRKAVFTIAVQ